MNWKLARRLLENARRCRHDENIHNLIEMILDELENRSGICKRLPEDLQIDRLPPADPFVISPPPPPDLPQRSRPVQLPHPYHKGNVEDAI